MIETPRSKPNIVKHMVFVLHEAVVFISALQYSCTGCPTNHTNWFRKPILDYLF